MVASLSLLLAAASPVTVSTQAELTKALAQAKGGETIQLAPGSYGQLTLNDRAFTAPVTITSADPARPGLFSRIIINRTANVTFSNVEASSVPQENDYIIRVADASNIKFDAVDVHGLLDGSVKDDRSGISVRRSEGVSIARSRFREIFTAVVFRQSKNVELVNSDISMIGNDAVEIPASDGVLIAYNTVSKFRTVDPFHPDFVQCWTTNEVTGCKNVRIIGNHVRADNNPNSAYRFPQGVFFGDEAKVGGHENIEITGNLFECMNWHAINIAVGNPKGIVIRDNRITACAPDVTPWIRVNDPDIKIDGNVAPVYFINSKAASVPARNLLGGAALK